MKKIIPITVLAMLCLFFKVAAQNQNDNIKPLKIGDELPESFWLQEHTFYQNGKISKQTLSAYKDKLLILDFWATWCGSCIKKFAFADSIKKVYGDRVAVILVSCANTKDKPERIAAVMGGFSNLFSITGDTVLTRLFPHRIIPHYVWIESGQFRSATGAEFFGKHGIEASIDRRETLNETINRRKQQSKKP